MYLIVLYLLLCLSPKVPFEILKAFRLVLYGGLRLRVAKYLLLVSCSDWRPK